MRRKKRQHSRMTTPETSTISVASLLGKLTGLSPQEIWGLLARMNRRELDTFTSDFPLFILPHQRPPEFAQGGAPWTTWLILGGRGAGKTRAGAEWVRAQAQNPSARIALVGETARDAREVMVEGV